MTLIKSISGIRGTIGGFPGDNLTPLDVVKFTAAFAAIIKEDKFGQPVKFVVGRDARISGVMVESLVTSTLSGMGIEVLNLGFSTTPTVEIAVIESKADAGIILTASHNPKQWNALKLLNSLGEFISDGIGKKVLELAEKEDFIFAEVEELGSITDDESYIDKHIKEVLDMELVNADAIKKAGFKVAVDGINSTGGIAIPKLLKALGVDDVVEVNCEPTGEFAHNPEPLAENLTEISKVVIEQHCDLGIVVDPDVDRLAFIMENGVMFGEEYTLVAVADYILQHKKGNTVSNLSSTRALKDITEKHGGKYYASAVGEVNVVAKMKEVDAVIGGEGNGGIIYPGLHLGRDALVGVGLFLTYLAQKNMKMTTLRETYPAYYISKNKVQLPPDANLQAMFEIVMQHFQENEILTIDGVKIEFDKGWVHIRSSNTEPILRVYAEGQTPAMAEKYASQVIEILDSMMHF
ncbi:MAG: phosphoglucosamine mutase [Bacteroidetes bacterium]|nr:MAG: phosphoglucosamine mutase [Bacteroidota bacterium]